MQPQQGLTPGQLCLPGRHAGRSAYMEGIAASSNLPATEPPPSVLTPLHGELLVCCSHFKALKIIY